MYKKKKTLRDKKTKWYLKPFQGPGIPLLAGVGLGFLAGSSFAGPIGGIVGSFFLGTSAVAVTPKKKK